MNSSEEIGILRQRVGTKNPDLNSDPTPGEGVGGSRKKRGIGKTNGNGRRKSVMTPTRLGGERIGSEFAPSASRQRRSAPPPRCGGGKKEGRPPDPSAMNANGSVLHDGQDKPRRLGRGRGSYILFESIWLRKSTSCLNSASSAHSASMRRQACRTVV